jgi:hypothetical protein
VSLGGVTAIGIFLLFGTITAFLAGTTLAQPGTFLDCAWALNPSANDELAPMGKTVGLLAVKPKQIVQMGNP